MLQVEASGHELVRKRTAALDVGMETCDLQAVNDRVSTVRKDSVAWIQLDYSGDEHAEDQRTYQHEGDGRCLHQENPRILFGQPMGPVTIANRGHGLCGVVCTLD